MPTLPLPARGLDHERVLGDLTARKKDDWKWRRGRSFSLVYHASDEHTALLERAYATYFHENALSPRAFPSLARLEAEVVAMVAHLLNGDDATAGAMTSGGTESILLAVKAYRDRARAAGAPPSGALPEMVLPRTAHPAFLKAAHYLDVRPVVVDVGADFRADARAVLAACNERTILVVCSAPSFPQGVIDPVAEIAPAAAARGIGCHVDACIGGFVLPFLEREGVAVPRFDLRVEGVTSISADLHKYAFGAKGASVVLYRNARLRRFKLFATDAWSGGAYGSPGVTGTRPGGAVAAAWAALHALGEDGYRAIAREVVAATERLKSGIAAIDGLHVVGEPAMSVLSFASRRGDIFRIADRLEARGWTLDRLQRPDSIHLVVTPAHAPIVDEFLADLRAASERAARELGWEPHRPTILEELSATTVV